jgi:glyoxylase-like metal-dependent hydrolase (beta-lactamase superfamily II)|tara:strand:- start:24 stop:605 length:582 start_codon:yes stop_codon:yes gene_type:complete
MVEEIAKDTYKIRGYANVYLITKPVPTIIDTGKKEKVEQIKKEIKKIIPLEEIKVVLLTHFHYDHCENLDIFPNAKFYAAKEEIEDFKHKEKYFHRHKFPKKTNNILKNKINPLPRKISGLDVVPVPGHTRGCIVFMDKKRKLIYTGDHLFCIKIGRFDLPNSVPEKMKQSLVKTINLIDKYDLELCPGHDEF